MQSAARYRSWGVVFLLVAASLFTSLCASAAVGQLDSKIGIDSRAQPLGEARRELARQANLPTSSALGDAWLMMVATLCTDPARERQFNAWYDDIDIPDVLEVPGYMRARRGLRLTAANTPVKGLPEDQGRYVALYDIASSNIDRTIIDMLMATRKMEMRGRSTDLLKVTERVYYRRHAPPVEAAGPVDDKRDFVYVERVSCCRNASIEQQFNAWYDRTHVPSVLHTEGLLRATRYELYRVLMVEPKEASRYLTVYELQAASPEEATMKTAEIRARLRAKGESSGWFLESGSTAYLKLKDVSREHARAQLDSHGAVLE